MVEGVEFLENDVDKAGGLQATLIERATGGAGDQNTYAFLRAHFLSNPNTKNVIPQWVKVNRNLEQFWPFISGKFSTYKERRKFIYDEFEALLNFLESNSTLPPEKSISESLKNFDSSSVNHAWQKALERKTSDPEGAITISRTILETVCKHILDARSVEYNSTNIELSELYKATAKELNLAPEQHTEKIFKQILGGCSAIVNGLGTLRNKLGDAHGKGKAPIKPSARHAELAVNLAGSTALFLIQTFNANDSN